MNTPLGCIFHRRKSEEYPSIFVPAHSFEGDIYSENGICQFDNPSENPNPAFPFLVRVGGGYRAFQKKTHAKVFYKED